MGRASDRYRAQAARSSLAQERGLVRAEGTTASARARRALRQAGQYRADSGSGPAASADVHGLNALVKAGVIRRTDANLSLAARYPGQRWAGGRTRAPAQPLPNRGTAAETFHVERLPERYDRDAVQRALDGVAQEAARADRAALLRQPTFQANSVDGQALKPGSVPAEALDLGALAAKAVSLPGATEALQVSLVQSLTMDRYVGGAGPGRIWEASLPAQAARARIALGRERFRIALGGQRFGVMSLRLPPDSDLAAQPSPGFLVQYGIVIAGIPHHLGRAPERLLALESIGDSPVSFRTLFATGGGTLWDSGGTKRDFYWNRTQEQHTTLGAYPFAEAFGSDTTLSPAVANLRDVAGFSVQLLSGTDAGEVFRQLCSRLVLGRSMRSDGHGPALTIPSGQVIEAPTCATAVDWLSPTSYTHRVESFDLTTARIVQGIPFSYDDCAALVPTSERFSVVLMPLGEKLVSQSPAPTYGTPAVWHQNGLRIVDSSSVRLRSWGLDIILE
jgi:hypothetical protein